MLARIHVSARRGRLHCLDSAKVSPSPKAYQKSSVKPSSPISTKEAQKTLSSLPAILAADECLWCRRDCLFEDIKYIEMEERKMVYYLGRLGLQLLTFIQHCKHFKKLLRLGNWDTPTAPSFSLLIFAFCVVLERNLLQLRWILSFHWPSVWWAIELLLCIWSKPDSAPGLRHFPGAKQSPFFEGSAITQPAWKWTPVQDLHFHLPFSLTSFWRASFQLLPSSSAAGNQWKQLLMFALSGQSY